MIVQLICITGIMILLYPTFESGRENYELCNIQNSSFLDLHYDLSDHTSPFRFTLPKLEILADSFKKRE